MRTKDTSGGASLFGFLIATVVFAVSFAAVVQFSAESGDEANNKVESDRAASASIVADMLLSTSGQGWYGAAPPCDQDGLNDAAFDLDALARIGLAEERCALGAAANDRIFRLGFEKLRNLRLGMQAADGSNGAVDYEEARRSLQLDKANLQFHLRTWPILPDVAQMLKQGYKDPNMRPLYIGDYVTSGGSGAPPYVAGYIDSSDSVTVYVTVTNDGPPTAFDALFELSLKGSKVSFTLHTGILAQDEQGNMSFQVRKTADWEWKDSDAKRVEFEVHDKSTKLIDSEISLAPVSMLHADTRVNVFAESEKLTNVIEGGVVVAKYHYQARDGKGKPVNFDDWTFRLAEPGGGIVRTDVLPNTKEGSVSHSFIAEGSYTATLWNDALTAQYNKDSVNIALVEPGPYGVGATTFAPGPAVLPEATLIDSLIQQFQLNVEALPYSHATIPYAAGGDIFPDIKDAMNDDLPAVLTDANGVATLDQYTTIIVGSDVDHNAMTSQAAKGTIRDWVLAGGTLIVFGSSDQSVNWLQPIFHAKLESASGGLATPDYNHPALHTPNDLDYEAFQYSTEWTYNSGADADFTHIVTSGTSGDILGASDPGAFGKGRVILSSWRPYALTTDQAQTCPVPLQPDSPCQAAFLLHNMVTLTYADLYLDYGPPVPMDAYQGMETRIATVRHPELNMDIEVYVLVYVFG